MNKSVDLKFRINAISRKSGKAYTDQNAVLFLASDKALPAALRAYRDECVKLGADPAQIESLGLLIRRVEEYHAGHFHEVKIADVGPKSEAYLLKGE